uniref:Uncharacterized protein n=1 Tax=Ditylenchus dipsaci TaxID=166011 RepID=A0A915CZI6_9BILA
MHADGVPSEAAKDACIQTSGAHDHRRLLDNGLSSPVKRKIEALDEPHSGKTAKHLQRTIQEYVELEGLVIPFLEQVENKKADNARKDLPKAKIHETAVEEIKEDVNFLARANSLLELAAEHYVYHQEYVWLIRSSCCNIDAELELMWTELLQAATTNDLDWTYSNWQRLEF